METTKQEIISFTVEVASNGFVVRLNSVNTDIFDSTQFVYTSMNKMFKDLKETLKPKVSE